MPSICARVMTRPVGLLGEQRSSARDFGVTARSMASGVGMKPSSSVVGRWTATPSCCAIWSKYGGKHGSGVMTSSPGSMSAWSARWSDWTPPAMTSTSSGVDFRP